MRDTSLFKQKVYLVRLCCGDEKEDEITVAGNLTTAFRMAESYIRENIDEVCEEDREVILSFLRDGDVEGAIYELNYVQSMVNISVELVDVVR